MNLNKQKLIKSEGFNAVASAANRPLAPPRGAAETRQTGLFVEVFTLLLTCLREELGTAWMDIKCKKIRTERLHTLQKYLFIERPEAEIKTHVESD